MTERAGQMIILNGEEKQVSGGRRLHDLLREMHIDPESVRGVAVAVNEEVVPRRNWGAVTLADGDRVEVVTAKQGG